MIAIGVQMGGPEHQNSAVRRALVVAMDIAEKSRADNYNDGQHAWVNPIYIVPGSVLNPDFEGYEFGHFSKKVMGLVIKIAVPQAVADGEGIGEFIVNSLRDVMRLSEDFFAKKKIEFSISKANGIIYSIGAGLTQNSYR